MNFGMISLQDFLETSQSAIGFLPAIIFGVALGYCLSAYSFQSRSNSGKSFEFEKSSKRNRKNGGSQLLQPILNLIRGDSTSEQETHPYKDVKSSNTLSEEERVFEGSLSLLSSERDKILNANKNILSNKNDASSTTRIGVNVDNKVVEYRTPSDLNKDFLLETGGHSFSLDTNANSDSSNALGPDCMIRILSAIQKFSVNTSHPYFFNQLFGATDPVSLAAELVALSVNTSNYTYETAPVFTMIEREVIHAFATLAGYDTVNNRYDGLMMPGGSLSNLTALHAARHQYLSAYYAKQDTSAEIPAPELVAFVSSEAHYSFAKAGNVIGIGSNMVAIDTVPSGAMNMSQLENAIEEARKSGKHPFFVGATAGSTVRGSFDPIEDIVNICERLSTSEDGQLWVHVDGAWGGTSVLSSRPDLKLLMRGLERADSFTCNPHKMLGAPQQTTCFVSRHQHILKASNSSNAKYLFDDRKNGAAYDLGDGSYTCGRRTDAIKFWAMWKYYGLTGLASQVEQRVDILDKFSHAVRDSDKFMLACSPWPFNVNFFYLPKRVRKMLQDRGIDLRENDPVLPDDISEELAKITVILKLKLHEAGEMMIPYQPISNQKADCFRLVIAGNKCLKEHNIAHIMSTMDTYGADL